MDSLAIFCEHLITGKEYRRNTIHRTAIAVDQEFRTNHSVQRNRSRFCAKGMRQRISISAGSRMITHKHRCVKAFINTFHHDARAPVSASNDLTALGQLLGIDISAASVCIFDQDIIRACGDSAFTGCFHLRRHLLRRGIIIGLAFAGLIPNRCERSSLNVRADKNSHN